MSLLACRDLRFSYLDRFPALDGVSLEVHSGERLALLDEPTAGLYPRTQAWLLELIEDLHRAGKTIVCATHDLHALERLADRCLVLSEDHRIVLDGTPEEVLGDPERLVDLNLVYAERLSA